MLASSVSRLSRTTSYRAVVSGRSAVTAEAFDLSYVRTNIDRLSGSNPNSADLLRTQAGTLGYHDDLSPELPPADQRWRIREDP